MKYYSTGFLFCIGLIILLGSISLFGQDADAALGRSAAAMSQPSESDLIRRRQIFRPPVVNLPENLVPRLIVTNAELTEFQSLLAEKDTGIFKLWNDICGDTKIIDVTKDTDCLEFTDFALGSQFSPYLQKYANYSASFALSKNRFLVQNNNQVVQILMDLGKRDLKGISQKTEEVAEFSKVKMRDRYGEFQLNKILESEALKSNRISLSYPADLGSVFLLRSLFWDNSQMFSWQRETIYAFQMVRFKDNIATIVWKKIRSKWA